jgi:predicted ATPase
VTFVFTDVEGSTRLLQELGAGYADALSGHRRIVREAFRRHGGVEVDTQGDAFFFAFARASDALAAALDAREGLEQSPIRVRMGLHTGEPIVTNEGYVGIDVHRAARIAAAGHGGQILVSQATRNLVGGNGLNDLGDHALKDLAAPERIYQLGDGDFPPLRSLRGGNLPRPAEPLVGRKKELADVLRLIRAGVTRLLTVTGAGGIGKTRCALEAASELEDDFVDGAWFVDLAPLQKAELVLPTIAGTIGARGDLSQHLRERSLLLFLDNFEHVLEAAPALAATIDGAPEIVVLATSRAALQIAGEHRYPLAPLAEAPAIELFRQRAETAAPGFEADYRQLAELCRKLDRLPLAIELAAARASLLSTTTLIDRLERRLPLLKTRRRDTPERHRTLEQTIAWSYELLTGDEQRLFAHLSVFAGGCTIEAAEEVCGADLDTLQALLDNSLLRSAGDRVSMLETIREYALGRLEERGETDDARRHHGAYFVALAEDVDGRIRGPEQYELVELLEREHDNMRAALDWYVHRDADSALRLVLALDHFWMIRDHLREADRWFGEALAAPGPADEAVRAHAARQAGHIASALGDRARARRLHEQSLSLALAAGSEIDVAHALVVLGRAEEGLRKFEELGDDRRIASALHRLGHQALLEGDHSRAQGLFTKEAELYRRCESVAEFANAVHSLGDCALRAGELVEAARRYRESLEIFSRLGSRNGVVYCVGGIASIAARRGDHAVAARLWRAFEVAEERLGYRLVDFERDYYEHEVAPALHESPATPPSEAEAVREALSYVE